MDPIEDDRGAEPSPRAARRPGALLRTSVPSGRAVTGGLLVAVATLLVFAAVRDDGGPAGRPVVVAARDVAPGARLVAADLAVVALDLPADGPVVADRPEVLIDAVALAPLRRGELVQASAVATGATTPVAYEVALTLPADRVVADRLRPGDRVDLLATTGSAAAARTDVVVRAAVVQQRSAPDGGLGSRDVGLTLGVGTPEEVLAATHALRAAEVTLVRTTGVGAPVAGPATWPPTPPAAS